MPQGRVDAQVVVWGLLNSRAKSSASPSDVSLNLLVVLSLINEVRKPSQLAELIRVIPKLRETVPQSRPLIVSL